VATAPKGRGKAKAAKGVVFSEGIRRAWQSETLDFGEMLAGPDVENALAMEAMRRGANMISVFKIISLRRDALRRSRMAHQLRGLGMETSPLSARLEWDPPFDAYPVWEDYQKEVRREWERLPGWIRVSFDFDAKEKKAWADVAADERRFHFYLAARPLYYQAGYSRPADQIFLKLSQPKFLDREVGGGVSESFAEALAEAEKLLIRWNSPLTRMSSLDFKQIYGFVPRFIAGSTTLSNHAFGLAVDIDAATNPHLKEGEKGPSAMVFDVLKKITGYDFGQSFTSGNLPPVDRARAIHQQQQEASQKLQAWLYAHIPDYISMARSQAGAPKPRDPLWKEDEFTRSLPTQTTLEAIDVRSLVTGYSLDGVKTWAREGIQTVPIDLAAALMEVGMRWGSEYDHSKDVMHFEQNPASKFLPKDSKRRPLTDLVLPGQHLEFKLVSDEDWVRGRW